MLKELPNIDNGIGVPDWRLALCLLFSWVVLFLTLVKGVQSSGKVAYFTGEMVQRNRCLCAKSLVRMISVSEREKDNNEFMAE